MSFKNPSHISNYIQEQMVFSVGDLSWFFGFELGEWGLLKRHFLFSDQEICEMNVVLKLGGTDSLHCYVERSIS